MDGDEQERLHLTILNFYKQPHITRLWSLYHKEEGQVNIKIGYVKNKRGHMPNAHTLLYFRLHPGHVLDIFLSSETLFRDIAKKRKTLWLTGFPLFFIFLNSILKGAVLSKADVQNMSNTGNMFAMF